MCHWAWFHPSVLVFKAGKSAPPSVVLTTFALVHLRLCSPGQEGDHVLCHLHNKHGTEYIACPASRMALHALPAGSLAA